MSEDNGRYVSDSENDEEDVVCRDPEAVSTDVELSIQGSFDHNSKITSFLFFHTKNRVVSSYSDGTIRLWSVKTRNCEKVIRDHSSPVMNLIKFRDDIFFSCEKNGKILSYKFTRFRLIREKEFQIPLKSHKVKSKSYPYRMVAFSGDQFLVAFLCGKLAVVHYTDLTFRELDEQKIGPHSNFVASKQYKDCFYVNPVSSSSNNMFYTIKLVNYKKNEVFRTINIPSGLSSSTSSSASKKDSISSLDIFDSLKNNYEIHTLLTVMNYQMEEILVYGGTEKTIFFYHVQKKTLLEKIKVDTPIFSSVAIRNFVVVGEEDGHLSLFQISKGKDSVRNRKVSICNEAVDQVQVVGNVNTNIKNNYISLLASSKNGMTLKLVKVKVKSFFYSTTPKSKRSSSKRSRKSKSKRMKKWKKNFNKKKSGLPDIDDPLSFTEGEQTEEHIESEEELDFDEEEEEEEEVGDSLDEVKFPRRKSSKKKGPPIMIKLDAVLKDKKLAQNIYSVMYFSNHKKLLSCSSDETLRVWYMKSKGTSSKKTKIRSKVLLKQKVQVGSYKSYFNPGKKKGDVKAIRWNSDHVLVGWGRDIYTVNVGTEEVMRHEWAEIHNVAQTSKEILIPTPKPNEKSGGPTDPTQPIKPARGGKGSPPSGLPGKVQNLLKIDSYSFLVSSEVSEQDPFTKLKYTFYKLFLVLYIPKENFVRIIKEVRSSSLAKQVLIGYHSKFVKSKKLLNCVFMNECCAESHKIKLVNVSSDETLKEYSNHKKLIITINTFLEPTRNEEVLVCGGVEKILFFYNINSTRCFRRVQLESEIWSTKIIFESKYCFVGDDLGYVHLLCYYPPEKGDYYEKVFQEKIHSGIIRDFESFTTTSRVLPTDNKDSTSNFEIILNLITCSSDKTIKISKIKNLMLHNISSSTSTIPKLREEDSGMESDGSFFDSLKRMEEVEEESGEDSVEKEEEEEEEEVSDDSLIGDEEDEEVGVYDPDAEEKQQQSGSQKKGFDEIRKKYISNKTTSGIHSTNNHHRRSNRKSVASPSTTLHLDSESDSSLSSIHSVLSAASQDSHHQIQTAMGNLTPRYPDRVGEEYYLDKAKSSPPDLNVDRKMGKKSSGTISSPVESPLSSQASPLSSFFFRKKKSSSLSSKKEKVNVEEDGVYSKDKFEALRETYEMQLQEKKQESEGLWRELRKSNDQKKKYELIIIENEKVLKNKNTKIRKLIQASQKLKDENKKLKEQEKMGTVSLVSLSYLAGKRNMNISRIEMYLVNLEKEENLLLDPSLHFRVRFFVGINQKIHNIIFHDTGREKGFKDLTLRKSEVLIDRFFETIVCDPKNDEVLKEFLKYIRGKYHKEWNDECLMNLKKNQHELTPKEVDFFGRLITEVSDFYGGLETGEKPADKTGASALGYPASKIEQECERKLHQIKTKKKNNLVFLGELKGCGICRHRSILFKAICDLVGIRCRLLRGWISQSNRNYGHCWNMIQIGGKFFLVDLMRSATILESDLGREYVNLGGPSGEVKQERITMQLIEKDYLSKRRFIKAGSYGTVYEVEVDVIDDFKDENNFTTKKSVVAVKELNLTDLQSTTGNDYRKYCEREMMFLKFLNHPNIVKYFGSFTYSSVNSRTKKKEDFLCLVMEFFDRTGYTFKDELLQETSPEEEIEEKNNGISKSVPFTHYHRVQELFIFFIEVCKGLRYMHSVGVIHFDLHPKNILVQWNDDLKRVKKVVITDFGGSKEMESYFRTSLPCGAPAFTAPEIRKFKLKLANIFSEDKKKYREVVESFRKDPRNRNLKFTDKSDVYSFGKLMEIFIKWFEEFPEVLKIQEQCLVENPDKRPSLNEIIYIFKNRLRYVDTELRKLVGK